MVGCLFTLLEGLLELIMLPEVLRGLVWVILWGLPLLLVVTSAWSGWVLAGPLGLALGLVLAMGVIKLTWRSWYGWLRGEPPG